MSRFRNFKSALEDGGVDVGTAELVPETAVELSDGVAAAVEEEAAVAAEIGDIEAAADVSEQIEDTTEVLEASVDPQETGTGQEEGVSMESMYIIQKTIGRQLEAMGISQHRVYPSTESFSKTNRSARVQATRAAIEGFKETVKNIWEAIKNMFKSVWEKIKGFFGRFFQNTEKLKKRAQEINKTIQERTTGKKNNGDKVKSSSIASAFNDNGKTDASVVKKILDNCIALTQAPTKLTPTLTNLGTNIKTFVDALGPLAEKDTKTDNGNEVNKTSAEIRTAIAAKAAKLEELVGIVKTAVAGLGVSPETGLADSFKKDLENYATGTGESLVEVYGPFIEDKYLVYKKLVKKDKADTNATDETIKEVTFSLAMESVEVKKRDESIPCLESNDMTSICKQVIDLADKTEAFKKVLKDSDNVMKASVDAVEAVLKTVDAAAENSGMTTKQAIAVAKGFVTSTVKSLQTTSVSLPVVCVRAGHRGLDYVVASLKLYK